MNSHDNGNDRLGTYFAHDPHTDLGLQEAEAAEDARIDDMAEAIREGLAMCTLQQRDVWRLATGIRDDGQVHAPASFPYIAELIGLRSKSTVEMHFLRADNCVLRAMLKHALGVRI